MLHACRTALRIGLWTHTPYPGKELGLLRVPDATIVIYFRPCLRGTDTS